MRKDYPLSKEEKSLYLACTLSPDRKYPYLVGWSLVLPKETDKARVEAAVGKLFDKHKIFTARIESDDQGGLVKYDCEEKPVIEYMDSDHDDPAAEEYFPDMDLNGRRLYRIVIVTTPSSLKLFMIFHHIILDGTGRQTMVRDFEAAFKGEDIGGADLAPYEFALKEYENEKSPGFAEDREYYNALLSGLECPSPDPDINEETESFHQKYYPFDRIDGKDVKNKKEQSGVRTSTIFLGAVGYALALFSGSDQSLVASAMSGRTDATKFSCGMFVRTLPMVCNIDPSREVNEYLNDLDDQTTKSREHSLYTYLDMSHELKLSLPISFAYQGDMIADRREFDGEERKMEFLRSDPSDYEMRLYLWRKDGKYLFEALYRSDHFSEGYMDSLADTIEQVLSELLIKEKMSEIDPLSSAQLDLLDGFNQKETDYDSSDVVSQFKTRVSEHPDSTLLIFKDKKISYREADEFTDKLASFISGSGIGREDVVSVLIPRCEYMVLASLGVLKAGAAYEPLDPSYPPERLEFMINDAESKLLIADRALMDRVPGYKGKTLFLDEMDKLPAGKAPECRISPKDRFIMLYTSGTTGMPKGVILEHGNLSAFCAWYRRYYSLTESSRVAAYASYGFDANMMDMYPAITTGACIVIIPEEDRLDLSSIKKRIDTEGVTHGFMTTQVCRQFAEYYDGSGSLKHLSGGGEKLVPIYVDKGFNLYNLYGPTECTIVSSAFKVDRLYRRIPIGKPLDNMKFYVCDKLLRRLPPGAPGELLISGRQVGRGYLNRPEKTAEAFITNPFTREEGYERCYRTGDVVRILPDGNADFMGRNDGQVKIRGFRIELGEVEAVIRDFPGIKDVTVQAFDAKSGGKFIAAYVVSDEKIDIDALNSFIGSRKPSYMIPASVMQIDRIPLNQNQKVNKRELPEPVFKREETAEGRTELNRLEKDIISLIKQAAGDAQIGVTGKLTDYGIDSINSIRLVPALNKKFKTDIPVAKLLGGMSVLDIENEILQSWEGLISDEAGVSGGSASRPKEKRTFSVLSPVQMAVYYDAIQKEGECLYNIPACYRFADTDPLSLKKAAEAAIAAHPCLSTHLLMQKGELLQVFNESTSPEVSYAEMSEKEFTARREGFVQPFDLMKGPLYRAEVIKTEKSSYLLLDVHHLIYDGFSSSILMDDICSALSGDTPEIEEYSAFDYASDEADSAKSPEYEAARKYYEDRFKIYEEPSMIPADLSGNEAEGLMGIVSVRTDKESVDKFCKETEITPAALFLSSTLYTASRYAGNKKTAVSMLSSGRNDSKTLRSVGMFVHTVPLIFDLDRDLSSREFVREVRKTMKDGIENEIYPFSSIAAEYGYRTEIMYEYQVGVTGEEKKFSRIPLALEAPKFKTAVVIGEEDGNYVITARYNDALYSKENMETFVNALLQVTRTLIKDKDESIRHISLMDSAAEEKVNGFGRSDAALPANKLLHRAFEAAAEKYPDRDALITSEGKRTFAELEKTANVIANNLKDKLAPGDGAVLLLPRRWYYFVAMFGVLKTGAFFIPCDPEYPADRISHIVHDAGARFIITTEEHRDSYPAETLLFIDQLMSGDETPVSEEVSPEDLSYMIYTSGSTGKPKGVELTHLGICNYVNAHKDSPFFSYIVEGPVKVVSVTTVSFDMSFKDTVGVLINGGTVIFADEEEMNDPRALSAAITKNGADVFSATPSRILQYLEYEPFKAALSGCRLVICGGEAYPMTLLKKLKEIGIKRILNSYGPTEITVSSNMADLTEADHISIGPPLPGYTEFIVDQDDNPVPAGVTGELLIGGPGVARGYHNLNEMTKKSFVTYNGLRVYRSGDYARFDKDGNVVILGRKDNQLKLRGLRIEPDEISGLMEEQDGIRKAVVVIRKISGQDNLCAYFTADKKIDSASLKDALSEKLTKYMVPTAYLQLDEIPVSPNGKTDFKALPEPEVLVSSEYEAPATDAEACFTRIFENVLKLERVGANDDFFEIGGTSLVAASVVIEAEREGYPIAFGDLFKHKTPRALAAFLTGKDSGSTGSAGNDISGYDLNAIDKALSRNTLDAYLSGKAAETGNILLTGATGFMGIHLLFEYLKLEKGTAYCLVRPSRIMSGSRRLDQLLFYYFGDVLGEEARSFCLSVKDRVVVLEGDVTDEGYFEQLRSYDINTVFNCAANVKHFSKGTDIEDVNVRGTDNCIRFCLETGARLIHFSTVSVSGTIGDRPENAGKVLSEQSMFFGQTLENQYAASKMKAELEVMSAVTKEGLKAKIIRVGSLSARERDGEFQVNYLSNSFAGRLRSYFVLEAFPYSMMDSPVRMGPIDASCRAFLKLAKTPDDNILFHAVNNDTLPLSALINAMKRCGIAIDYVDDEEFDRRFREAEEDPGKAKILQSISAYRSLHNREGMRDVSVKSGFTTQLLAREGFFWPTLGTDYVENFVNGLIGLGFFDEDYLNR